MYNLKFGCQSYPWKMGKHFGQLPRMLKVAAEAGFQSIECEIDMLGTWFHDPEGVKKQLEKYNIEFAALVLHQDWNGMEETVEEAALSREAIEFVKHFPNAKIETTASTAFAARFVADNPDQPYAAIAPHAAAKEYGLQILAKDIQEIEKNYTRFWVLGNTVPEIPLNQIDCKLTLALTLPDNMPGALYKALSTFAWRGIDLTKIESRPLKTVLGEYFFIIDCDYTKEKLAQFALEELTAVGIGYKILGAYQVYEI